MNKKINFKTNKILVQSMTNTKTHDVKATIEQINKMHQVGCHLVRVAIFDDADAEAIKEIVQLSPIPIIADIHFNYLYAISAIKSGVSKIRLNPGNINKPDEIKEIVDVAKEYDIAIRIGVNSGSIPIHILKKYNEKICSEAMLESLDEYLNLFKQFDFQNIVISLKASDPILNLEVNRLAKKKYNFPIHIGVTEAGPLLDSTIKSTIGLAPLLQEGVASTIRISISDDPVIEVKVAYKILNALKINNDRVNIVSCPTCGRLNYNMFEVVQKVEKYCEDKFFPLTISILGCIVNGIGEGKHADIGIAGSYDEALIFEKGKIIKRVNSSIAFNELKELIDKYYEEFNLNKVLVS
ncbi:MAG: flavodoxin-dependent (E)-4-hydroxy-3-methylbut-2-enyl-diphosphate synthase [Mycoplasma sp.]